MGKRIREMMLFQMIEYFAAPKILWILYITIEAPHSEHIIRRQRYCNMLSYSKIRRGWTNPCFSVFYLHCIHQPWHFETSLRKEKKCKNSYDIRIRKQEAVYLLSIKAASKLWCWETTVNSLYDKWQGAAPDSM